MKRTLFVVLIIAALLIGLVSAADDSVGISQPIGGDVGYYDITSSPSGASVTLDGKTAGTTPTTASVYSTGTPGHTIEVTKSGYQAWSKTYPGNPQAGQHVAVNAVLVPVATTPAPPGGEKGYYHVTSNPGGGSVTFDGTMYGSTPVTISVSTSGTPGHTITVTKSGYQTWSQSYPGNPQSGQTINVVANLVPVEQYGNIYVTSSPSGASAVLDNGYDQLYTPGTFNTVSAGWHNIQVSQPGYTTYSNSVLVSSGQTTNVFAPLSRSQQTGSISVSSTPVSASLYVDSIYQGLTNQIVSNLVAGAHTVTLKKSGYQTYQTTSIVNGGQITYLSVTLTPVSSPKTGDLEVTSSPSGASVYLNSDYQGETTSSGPLYVTDLNPGTYTTVLKKSGYQDYSTTTTIAAGSTSKVSATLQPSSTAPTTASVEITSQPSGANVYVNNAYVGITPISFENVQIDPSKTYTVQLKLDGYEPYSSSGSLKAGQIVQINAALTPVAKPPEPAGINMTWLIAGGIVVLAIIGGAAYFLMKKKKNEQKEKTG